MDAEKKPAGDSSFFLSSSHSSFSSKSKDIFSSLDALEKKHNAHQKTQDSFESLQHMGVVKSDPLEEDATFERKGFGSKTGTDHQKQDHIISLPSNRFRQSDCDRNQHRNNHNRRDVFRKPRPMAKSSRQRQVPDFKVHPDRWKCYSLEDVSDEDLTDKANKRAALDFLFERKKERERQERIAEGQPEEADEERFESDTAACSKGLITFSRKKLKSDKITKPDDSSLSSVNSRDLFSGSFEDCGNEEKEDDSDFKKGKTKGASYSENEQMRVCTMENCEAVVFKSRKNVKKHIRRRGGGGSLDDENSEDG